MSILLYRIDDRLIHGQIITGWARDLSATHIYIIDNKVAKDAFLKQVMSQAAPKDVKVVVITMAEAVKALIDDPPEHKTIVLTKNPATMLALLEGGLPMKELNVGGMGSAPGRKCILRNIQASPEELDTLHTIASKGVRVFFQIVPSAKLLELDKVK